MTKKRSKATYPPARPKPANNLANQSNSLTSANQKVQFAQTEVSAFSGPIPPPDLLARYDEIIPDGADRILKMAEKQSSHRQHLEKWAVIGGTILSYFGVLCALIIALFTLYFGAQLIREGHVVSGSIFAGSGLIGLVTSFIYGTRSRREERLRRDQKNKAISQQK